MFISPLQTREPLGIQAVVGLIALGILVWGVRELIQWKALDAGRRVRYVFIVILSSIILVVSLRRVYHEAGNRTIPASGYSYSMEQGTCTITAYDHPVAGCSTYAK